MLTRQNLKLKENEKMNETNEKNPAADFNGGILAYLGDAQFELLVRKKLVLKKGKLGKLNKDADALVRAGSQSKAADRLQSVFTEEELSMYRRGKNIHTNSIPKNATALEYRKATGLEAVFGYLSLKGDIARMEYLLEVGFFAEEQGDTSADS